MNSHPTREEDFDLYALGALDADEKLAFESHVSACPDCARKLAEAQGRIALLAFSAPPAEPSPAVKQRLLAQVRGSLETHAPAPAASLAPRVATPRSSFFRPWWTAILVPMGVALALVTIFLWNQNARLDRELAGLRATVALQQSQIDAARRAVDLAQATPASFVWTGWISDSHCGVKGMNAAHKDCAMKCIKEMHAYWVFVDSRSKSVLKIHNQDDVVPATSLGAEMKITGHVMDDGTLEVENIAAAR